MKKQGKTMTEASTGALKTGPRKGDGSPKGKAMPIDRGERMKGKNPMRKGK